MSVTQIAIGRFHHFHLARQLEKHGLLDCIWTGYPSFKLRDEAGIARTKIKSFPWLHGLFMAKASFSLPSTPWLDRELLWHAHTSLDRHASRRLGKASTLIALSGTGLESGRKIKEAGGIYYCDRGSTHIRFQDRILREEHARWNEPFDGIDPRMIAREEAEYESADRIAVPSNFVARSFVEMGVPVDKLYVNPYGARLDRFRPTAEPDANFFTVLFVGEVSLRKGFPYLIDAFKRLPHPKKRMIVVGSISPGIRATLSSMDLANVEFRGLVPNTELGGYYSSANVMVLPSIEEGLAMVIGEALACGCPVIATKNTGAEDFFTDSVEGFIVPIRSPDAILYQLEKLIDDQSLQAEMRECALRRVSAMGGWDSYGTQWVSELCGKTDCTLIEAFDSLHEADLNRRQNGSAPRTM